MNANVWLQMDTINMTQQHLQIVLYIRWDVKVGVWNLEGGVQEVEGIEQKQGRVRLRDIMLLALDRQRTKQTTYWFRHGACQLGKSFPQTTGAFGNI